MPASEVAGASIPEAQVRHQDQRLVVAWQHPHHHGIHPIGLLSYDGRVHRFAYIRNALDVQDFQPLLGFGEFNQAYESEDLFPIFAQRAMDPRRPDYQRYVERLGLEGDPGPWEQIARSQGRRDGDSIQLFPEPIVTGDELTFLFLVHGIRHVHEEPIRFDGRTIEVTREQVESALDELRPGDLLDIVPEPGNFVNPQAIVVMGSRSVPVGWVPDLLVDDVRQLKQQAHVNVTAVHINGPDAPSHLRLLARLRGAPVGAFRFFRGERWELLAGETGQ
jgi:hypothetical protein